jgi:Spore germination protein
MDKRIKILLTVAIGLVIIIGLFRVFVTKEEDEFQNQVYTPAEEISEEQAKKTNILLWFVGKETGRLATEQRFIDMRELLQEPATKVLREWMLGPQKDILESPFPVGTKLNSISIEDGVARVDLSKEFIENHPGTIEKEENTIYALVNTLTELTEINKIKILIDGEENLEFTDGLVKFNQIFERR